MRAPGAPPGAWRESFFRDTKKMFLPRLPVMWKLLPQPASGATHPVKACSKIQSVMFGGLMDSRLRN